MTFFVLLFHRAKPAARFVCSGCDQQIAVDLVARTSFTQGSLTLLQCLPKWGQQFHGLLTARGMIHSKRWIDNLEAVGLNVILLFDYRQQ